MDRSGQGSLCDIVSGSFRLLTCGSGHQRPFLRLSPSVPSGEMFTPVSSLLDQLRGVLDALGSVDWRASDPDAVACAAVALARGADRLEAISLLAIAEHDRRGGVGHDGDGSLGD